MTPAVQYVRASTGLQSCSIEQQTLANAAYAAVRDFKILATYSDDGVSGLTLKARPALQRLLADALAPGRSFQAILVYDVSRWGRFQDIDEGAHYEFLCRQAGVAVHYCAEPFENEGSPEANLIKQVKRAMAAEYSRAQSDRVTMAKRHMIAKGFTASAPPFALLRQVVDRCGKPVAILARGELKASSSHRTVFIPGPPEAVATVRAIFRRYVITGLSLRALAATLNDEGAPSPSGRGWSAARLPPVLRQEAYVGTYVYGRVRHRLGASRKAPPEAWQRVEHVIPPIVDRRMFDQANALLRGRRWRTDDELLDELRDLLAHEGQIDAGRIAGSPYMVHPSTYERRFGSLSSACSRIGYAPRWGRQ